MLPPLPGLEPPAWGNHLLQAAHRRMYPGKVVIEEPGMVSSTIRFVVSGSVRRSVPGPESEAVVLGYLFPSDFFGHTAYFEPGMQSLEAVESRGPCTIAELGYATFARLVEQHPAIGHELAAQVSARHRMLSHRVHDIALLNVMERLQRMLVELAALPDAITHPDGMLIRITRLELGLTIGCSREMVGRVLRIFEERGLLYARGKTIVIRHCSDAEENASSASVPRRPALAAATVTVK